MRGPFTSSLILSSEKEKRMVERTLKRLEKLERALGRSETGEADWYEADAVTDKHKVALTFVAELQLL